MSGMTSGGFTIKTLPEIEAEIEAALRAAFGVHINTTAPAVFGQIKSIFAEREALIWEALQDLYNANDPDHAAGITFDHVMAITAHRRLAAGHSRCNGVVFSGTDGTVIPADTLVSVDGAEDVTFSPETAVTIIGGSAVVDCVATQTGPITVVAGALTNIVTPISGLGSVTNPADAIVGRDLETDAEAKIRRNTNLAVSNAGPADAIRKAILALNEDTARATIEDCRVLENYELETDARGIPGKSVMVVVYQAGGVTDRDQEIADVIMLTAKSAGIRPYGDVELTSVSSDGLPRTCYISRPDAVPIYLEIDLTVNGDYPENGDARVADILVAWGNGLGSGVDVIVYPALVAQVAAVDGITDLAIRIGRTPGPTGDANVSIDDGSSGTVERSEWSLENITVTST